MENLRNTTGEPKEHLRKTEDFVFFVLFFPPPPFPARCGPSWATYFRTACPVIGAAGGWLPEGPDGPGPPRYPRE